MNKMKTIDDIRQRVAQIIKKEIEKTKREIADFEQKIKDNEVYYGGGGWYTQFEKAKERREKYLKELRAFGEAQAGAVVLDTLYIYSYYCPRCVLRVMLSSSYGEKVDCPKCGRPIYKCNDGEEMQVKRGSRIARVNGNFIQLTTEGRVKE